MKKYISLLCVTCLLLASFVSCATEMTEENSKAQATEVSEMSETSEISEASTASDTSETPEESEISEESSNDVSAEVSSDESFTDESDESVEGSASESEESTEEPSEESSEETSEESSAEISEESSDEPSEESSEEPSVEPSEEPSEESSEEISEEPSEEPSEETSEEPSEETSEEPSEESSEEQITGNVKSAKMAIIGKYFDSLDKKAKSVVTDGFIDWVESEYGGNAILKIKKALDDGTYSYETWYDVTGSTVLVLDCYYKNVFDKSSKYYRDDVKVIGDTDGKIVIRFTGDVSLADNWDIMPKYDARGGKLEGILSAETIEALRGADITLVNNEFCYSTRGTPLPGKTWTFRADPSRVNIFKELGVDVVSLANNHAYDYGETAFLDTLETLRNADLPYIGGGKDLDEAQKPFYFIVNGRMISFAAASRAEVNKMTPQATDTTPGILRTYDATLYNGVLKKAAENSDYCVAYVHWGVENSYEIGDGLYSMGAGYIDSGADIVVGAHAHRLQGIEFYDSVPIVFNLGNFLFTSDTVRTAIFELTLDADTMAPVYRIIPCLQASCKTEICEKGTYYWNNILDFMRGHSYKVKFTDDGYFTAE